MNKVIIKGEEYILLDTLEKISIADSFVIGENKIGSGSGEAKLYVGQVGDKLQSFFGERGFEINCFLSRTNLLRYLDSSYSEYLEPSQSYRLKEQLPKRWDERKANVISKDAFVSFMAKDQNQIDGPRLYINSTNSNLEENNYILLRKLSLPIITHLNIYKLKNSISQEVKYFFCLFLNGVEENLYEELNEQEERDSERDKFIPNSEYTEDVEKELSNDDVIINSPFDPNKIKVRTTPSTIGQIINDLEDHFIDLNTEFQRLPNLWDLKKKSRFIESLLLKLPIPAFYFNEKEENNLEVIDGLQRISTIKSFVIDKEFKLKDLEFLKEYNGSDFASLPSTLSRRIKTFPITTYIIEKGTPNDVKFNIFKRVNTGGLELKPQEIRHAINQGKPSDLIADLVRHEDEKDENKKTRTRRNYNNEVIELKSTKEGKMFAKATDNKIASIRMEDRDFATRFVSFYLISYKKYKPDLDTFLNNGMSKIRSLDDNQRDKLKDDFYNALKLAYDIFGDDAFRKRFKKTDNRKPINKALFEVLSVNFAKLSEEERAKLKLKKTLFKSKLLLLHNRKEGDFLRAITQGTAQESNVLKRFTEIEKIIKETLEND